MDWGHVRLRHWHWVHALLGAACTPTPNFQCQDAAQCVLDGQRGRCEESGYCTYVDDDCPSGRRFGRYAGAGLASTCLPETEPATTGESSSGGPGSGSGTSFTTTGGGSTTTGGGSTTTGTPIPPDWWDTAWTSRIPVSLSAALGEEPLFDIPLLVVLDAERIAYADASPDGRDLRMVDRDTLQVIPLELERWDAEGRSFLWMRISELPADSATSLHLYYGNPDALPPETTPVWDDSYASVWHMDDLLDASNSNLDGDPEASTVSFAPGKAGRAAHFDPLAGGGGVQFQVGSAPAIVDVFAGEGGTVEAWFRLDDADGGLQLVNKSATGFGQSGWTLKTFRDDRVEFRREVGDTVAQYAAPSAVTADTWHHAAVVFSDEAPELGPTLYFDGLPVDVEVFTAAKGAPVTDNGEPLLVGNDQADERPFIGDIDEVRLSRVPRSSSFIRTQFEAMNDRVLDWGEVEQLEIP